MTLEELYHACLSMKVDEEREFDLKEPPRRGELGDLTILLGSARSEVAFAMRRSRTHLWVQCYQPKT